ncbi:MAG TPA: hypothetical protein PLG47_04805 [Candidatus Dojkabacteria bacterium]|nr:hypothetical protein [Candidatus Dojkabacteria bacterium]
MSIICGRVYEDRIEIAADSCITDETVENTTICNSPKLVKIDNIVVGACGYHSDALLLFSFIEENIEEFKKISCVKDLMVLTKKYRLYNEEYQGKKELESVFAILVNGKLYESKYFCICEIKEFCALGIGYQCALGSLEYGASPTEACKIASKYLLACKPPIITYTYDLKTSVYSKSLTN